MLVDIESAIGFIPTKTKLRTLINAPIISKNTDKVLGVVKSIDYASKKIEILLWDCYFSPEISINYKEEFAYFAALKISENKDDEYYEVSHMMKDSFNL